MHWHKSTAVFLTTIVTFMNAALLRDYATSIAQSHILAKSETKPLAVQNERTKNGSLDQLFYN